MTRCKNATKYKGMRPPKCNNGEPCKACVEIYDKKGPSNG